MGGRHHKYKRPRHPRDLAPPYCHVGSTATRRTRSKIEHSNDGATSINERPPAKKARTTNDLPRELPVVKPLALQATAKGTRRLPEQAAESVPENSILRMRIAALESMLKNVQAKNERAEARIADLEEKDARREADVTEMIEMAAADINKAEEGKSHAEAQVKKLTEEATANSANGRPMLQHEYEAHLTHETLRARNQEFTVMMKDLTDMNAVVRRLKREEGVPSSPINVRFRNRLGTKPSPLMLCTSIDDARQEYLARNSGSDSKIPRDNGSVNEDWPEINHRSSSFTSINGPRASARIVDRATLTKAAGVHADEQSNGNDDHESSAETVPSGKKKKERLRKRAPHAGKKKGKRQEQASTSPTAKVSSGWFPGL